MVAQSPVDIFHQRRAVQGNVDDGCATAFAKWLTVPSLDTPTFSFIRSLSPLHGPSTEVTLNDNGATPEEFLT